MDVNAFNISKHLSELMDRHVAVKEVAACEFGEHKRTACYTVQPHDGTAIVQINLGLLADLCSIMIGYPKVQVEEQVKSGKLDANLEDAAREVMNVISAVVVSEGRAIFKGLYPQALAFSKRADELARGRFFPLRLQITPTGFKAGYMMIGSDCA